MDEELFSIPTGDELKSIRNKLDQDADKIEHNLSLFLNWLSYEKHLPQDCDHNFLRNYIAACKGDLEKVKKKYECYCYAKLVYTEYGSNRIMTSEKDLKCLDFLYILPLPKMTADGCRISVYKAYNMDAFDILAVVRYMSTIMDYMLCKDTILAGQIIIVDMECIKPKHYAKIFNTMYLKFHRIARDIYPSRINKIIIMDCDPYLEKGINLLKSILPQKTANRTALIKGSDELRKLIPASCLPSDYGGSLNSMMELSGQWKKRLMENEEFLRKISQSIPTGSIPKKFIPHESEFGIEGSFRKLNID